MKFAILPINKKANACDVMEPAEMLTLAQSLYAKVGKTVPADVSVLELVKLLGNMLTIIEAVDDEAAAVIEDMEAEMRAIVSAENKAKALAAVTK